MIRAALTALLLAAPAWAEDLVSAPEFQGLSEDHTLFFEKAGEAYGAEQYLPGRRVIWQYQDGSCDAGFWYGEGQSLCFVYESSPEPQCWLFARRQGGLFARVEGLSEGDPSELQLSRKTDKPLECIAPNLGV